MSKIPNLDTMLAVLEKAIRADYFTPAKIIDETSFVCLMEETAYGKKYWQLPFKDIPLAHQDSFLGLQVGNCIGLVKIIAVFDTWYVEVPKPVKREVS